MTYGVLKLLHILAVVAWIGGAAALSGITAAFVRAKDYATLRSAVPHIQRHGQMTGALSSLVVLVTGIAMVQVGGIGFGTRWVGLGFLGLIVSAAFGPLVLRKRAVALGQALASGDGAAIDAAGARVRAASLLYLAITAAVIAVMVLKPTG